MKIKRVLEKVLPKLEYNISTYGTLVYNINYEKAWAVTTNTNGNDTLHIHVTFERLDGPKNYSVANRVLFEQFYKQLNSFQHYMGYDRVYASLGECEPTDCI